MNEPVLLTGATGFVGRAVLAELLAQGLTVHAVARTPGPAQDRVVWHSANLLSAEGRAAVAGLAPRLIHCAWDVTHGSFWHSPANALWQAASIDLVRRCHSSGIDRVVVLGTCAEYDAQAPGPWNEDRPIAPATAYGQAKAALWRTLDKLCGERLIWARLFHMYGLGEDRRRLIPFLIDRLRAGELAEVRAADLVRDFASTAHVARCLKCLLDSNANGAFDIGSGTALRLSDIAHILAAASGPNARLRLLHKPDPKEPTRMAPDLSRLHAVITMPPEDIHKVLFNYFHQDLANKEANRD